MENDNINGEPHESVVVIDYVPARGGGVGGDSARVRVYIYDNGDRTSELAVPEPLEPPRQFESETEQWAWRHDPVLRAMHHALSQGIRRFVVDVSQVGAMDSAAAGELVSWYSVVHEQEGRFACVCTEAVRALLTQMKVADPLMPHLGLEGAVASVRESLR